MSEKIASVISFCTHDLRFLDRCIRAVEGFSSQILIPVCDHFYNGKPEDLTLLRRIYAKYPNVDFIEFFYSEEALYGTCAPLIPGSPGWAQHWHNSARLVSFYFLCPEIEYVLFLDTDEIFSQGFTIGDFDAIRFATYWYFKRVDQVATVYPDGPVLVRRENLQPELLIDENERFGLFHKVQGKKVRQYIQNEKPLVHHYSWVRTREEMLAKVRSWGHHWERDWESMLDQEEDFVRRYTYQKSKIFWDPFEEMVVLPDVEKEPRYRVTPKELFHKEVKRIIEC